MKNRTVCIHEESYPDQATEGVKHDVNTRIAQVSLTSESNKKEVLKSTDSAAKDGIIQKKNSQNRSRGNCCDCFLCFIFCCSSTCYIFCPPIPSQITRKLAFHPPVKGNFYRLKYVSNTGKEIEAKSAKQAYGKNCITLEPLVEDLKEKIYVQMNMSCTETFIIKTSRKHYLTCLLFKSLQDNNKVILFSQANATDLGILMQQDLHMRYMSQELDIDIYCYDYSGFGLSTGTPSEKNIYDDILAVYEHIARTRPGVKIILMGLSMGTAASIDLASKQLPKLAGVILFAPFSSGIRLLMSAPGKDSTTCCDPFQSIDKCRLIDVPTLLIHGCKDEVVPLEHSKEIYKKLKKPVKPLYIYEADHMTVFSREYDQIIRRVHYFIDYELIE